MKDRETLVILLRTLVLSTSNASFSSGGTDEDEPVAQGPVRGSIAPYLGATYRTGLDGNLATAKRKCHFENAPLAPLRLPLAQLTTPNCRQRTVTLPIAAHATSDRAAKNRCL